MLVKHPLNVFVTPLDRCSVVIFDVIVYAIFAMLAEARKKRCRCSSESMFKIYQSFTWAWTVRQVVIRRGFQREFRRKDLNFLLNTNNIWKSSLLRQWYLHVKSEGMSVIPISLNLPYNPSLGMHCSTVQKVEITNLLCAQWISSIHHTDISLGRAKWQRGSERIPRPQLPPSTVLYKRESASYAVQRWSLHWYFCSVLFPSYWTPLNNWI